jgi:hypothetical protein
MLKIFQALYPEYMDGNQIRYPIEDQLITKMKELHSSDTIPPKPEPHKVLVGWREFEDMLYIWEFCNNFIEFLEIPAFKIEELYVALTYTGKSLVSEPDSQSDNPDLWMEEASMSQLEKRGLGFLNQIHIALT